MPIFEHCFLEMTDGDRRLHQFRRLAKIGFTARRIDQRVDLAATNEIEPEKTASPDFRDAGENSRSAPTGPRICRRR